MLKFIIQDIGEVFRFLPYGIVAGIIIAILLSAVNDRRLKRQKSPIPVMAVTCFFMYLVIIIFITLLSREGGSRQEANFKLFSTWGINARNNAFVIENVLLFIPYGFVCAWAIKAARRFWVCALLGLLTSAGIECMQLVTGLGLFEVDDILTNVLGMVIGYILFRCVLNEGNTERRRTRLIYVILAVLMVAAMILAIISFSSNSSAESNDLSRKVATFVVNKSDTWLELNLSKEDKYVIVRYLNPVVRKIAHATEYGALAVVIGFGFQAIKRKRAKVVNYFYSVMMCGMIAILDEGLQKYVFSRTGQMGDVFIDVLGAVAGGCFYIFLSDLFEFLAGDD